MPENVLLLIVFASQAIVVSLLFPWILLRRMDRVIETYPPSRFPRLHPVPVETIRRSQRRYRAANATIAAVGLVLVSVGFYSPAQEMLGWDSQSVIGLFFVLQMAPWSLIGFDPGFSLFNGRRAHARRTRTAELRPRRLFDFVSPAFVALAAVVYLAFVTFVLFAPHLWGAGHWNILFVTLLNLVLAASIVYTLHEKRKDHFQAHEDRMRRIGRAVRLIVFTSIAATVFLALSAGLKTVGAGLDDIATSLYLQLIALASLGVTATERENYDVYRDEAIAG